MRKVKILCLSAAKGEKWKTNFKASETAMGKSGRNGKKM